MTHIASTAVTKVINHEGRGAFVLACEHASNHIPSEFKNLGLTPDLQNSHIAWDPCASEIAQEMATHLDSPLVIQGVSRLVVDCNRPPMSKGATPAKSEIYTVPGNVGLSETQRTQRTQCYYQPFYTALSGLIAARLQQGFLPVVATVHSFSPVYKGVQRNTGIGLIDDADDRFARAMFDCLSAEVSKTKIAVHRNEPYSRRDDVTHTLSAHARPYNLLHVMIEIRNDLIAAQHERQNIARLLSDAAQKALASFTVHALAEGA